MLRVAFFNSFNSSSVYYHCALASAICNPEESAHVSSFGIKQVFLHLQNFTHSITEIWAVSNQDFGGSVPLFIIFICLLCAAALAPLHTTLLNVKSRWALNCEVQFFERQFKAWIWPRNLENRASPTTISRPSRIAHSLFFLLNGFSH